MSDLKNKEKAYMEAEEFFKRSSSLKTPIHLPYAYLNIDDRKVNHKKLMNKECVSCQH